MRKKKNINISRSDYKPMSNGIRKSGKDVIRMKKAMVLMAEGFEEVEALTVVDILRRAEVQADMCSISNSLDVKGAQGIQVRADRLLSDVKDVGEYDA